MTAYRHRLTARQVTLLAVAVGLVMGIALGWTFQWVTGSMTPFIIFVVLGPTVLGPSLMRFVRAQARRRGRR